MDVGTERWLHRRNLNCKRRNYDLRARLASVLQTADRPMTAAELHAALGKTVHRATLDKLLCAWAHRKLIVSSRNPNAPVTKRPLYWSVAERCHA